MFAIRSDVIELWIVTEKDHRTLIIYPNDMNLLKVKPKFLNSVKPGLYLFGDSDTCYQASPLKPMCETVGRDRILFCQTFISHVIFPVRVKQSVSPSNTFWQFCWCSFGVVVGGWPVFIPIYILKYLRGMFHHYAVIERNLFKERKY